MGRLAGWARDHDARFFVMYGATECTARMAYLPWEHAFDHSDCIGVAIPGGAFRIVDVPCPTVPCGAQYPPVSFQAVELPATMSARPAMISTTISSTSVNPPDER